ncbi:hypothetical protein FSP39_008644 [Pinctada imbricata]|uniref:BZIP domain-containing protein n=1 Tax=Pinctada imbricata TaxID=66713 RepID=A0AA88XW09_PINIB|nr:hypothetical protein FSP39_008644 [Pinctada imbricata]
MENDDAVVCKITAVYEEVKPLNLSLSTKAAKPVQTNVKQSLKSMIQARRIAEGKGDLTVDWNADSSKDIESSQKLSEEELARQEIRKEQNRKAALRCREKKKNRQLKMKEGIERLRKRNKELLAIYRKLNKEKNDLIETIRQRDSCFLPENSDSLLNSELPDQAVPVSAASEFRDSRYIMDRQGENSASASNDLSDSEDENLVIMLSSSDEDSGNEEDEDEALDLSVKMNVKSDLPHTFTPEVSDDEKPQKFTREDSDDEKPQKFTPEFSYDQKLKISSPEDSDDEKSRTFTPTVSEDKKPSTFRPFSFANDEKPQMFTRSTKVSDNEHDEKSWTLTAEVSEDNKQQTFSSRVFSDGNPQTFTPEVSDDENDLIFVLSQRSIGTQHDADSGYPSSSYESDFHLSSQEC